MKNIILAILLSSTLSADTFFEQQDKQKHIVGSIAIAGVCSALAKHYGSSPLESWFIGFGSSIIVGIAKEAIDGRGYGTEDIGDVYADTIGAVSGSLISTQFNLRF